MKHINMRQMALAIVIVGVLVAGAALSAEAGGGRAGGFHGGRSGWHGGGFRGSHGFHRGGARWGHGIHGRRFHGGTRVFIGGAVGLWGWPGWWGAPYPAYVAPPVVVPPGPTEYIQQEPALPADAYWYYCQSAGAYYPYVKECPGGWMQVVPQPAPGSP
jgi:hypothetical protein